MSDLFGYAKTGAPFKDIRNQRETSAQEKAELCKVLNEMLRRSPRAASISNVMKVRAFKAAHKFALAVLRNPRASRQELQTQINSMRSYYA